MRPLFIAFIAPVGAGKTYIARRLAKTLGAAHINTDAVRVRLRRQGESMARAMAMADRLHETALKEGKSVIADFDAVAPKRQEELRKLAKRSGARFVVIKIKTPERLILGRLKQKRYTAHDLFRNAREATRVYFMRKARHQKLRTEEQTIRPHFVVDNARPLAPQITNIVERLQTSKRERAWKQVRSWRLSTRKNLRRDLKISSTASQKF